MGRSSEDDDEERRLCTRCVGEPVLKALVQTKGRSAPCSFCDSKTRRTLTLEEVADRVEQAFEDHYVQTSDQPSSDEEMLIRFGDSEFERHGEPIVDAIGEAAGIDQTPAQEIQEILADRHYDMDLAQMNEESPFDADSNYARLETQDDAALQEDWAKFEQTLKGEARFFSRSATATLAGIFDHVDSMTTRANLSVIRMIGPGEAISTVFRARAIQSHDTLLEALARPDLKVGPPPSSIAKAGRMNARGIPVFYGATEWEIALAEVRPPVGSNVVVAEFEIMRPLRVLDVKALADVFVNGSIFDETLADRARRALFLQKLSAKIIAPVMPDMEDFDYLVTQAMAEYLADHPGLELDGIYFPSVQYKAKGANIMLFHKASRLAPMDIPEDTEIFARLAGGGEEDEGMPPVWRVYETTPNAADTANVKSPSRSRPGMKWNLWADLDDDPREPALQLVPDTVIVRHIEGVRFRTTATTVMRNRRKARPKGELEPF